MLSVANLLNPISPEPGPTKGPSSPTPSLRTSTSSHGSPQLSTFSSCSIKKPKMTKDGAIFAKGKIKGEVNYPPFERFDEDTMREIRQFQVYPLGEIQTYARHIPYNSEKKSFLEKTGRESFEVFQYAFKVPGDDKEYYVLWDYNIGLVRITPFFKCLQFTKTTPAKMLNVNPGLKDITHSITGGALAAQGYWMPYNCALAVCTTFCATIAPALIPLFGPTFPSLCVPPEAPEYKRWTIDPALIVAATAQAEAYRLKYSSTPTPYTTPSFTPTPSPSSSTVSSPFPTARTRLPSTLPSMRRLRKRIHGADDTDTGNTSEASSADGNSYFCSPSMPPHHMSPPLQMSYSQPFSPYPSAMHANHISHSANSSLDLNAMNAYSRGPSPWLSAIPRSTGHAGWQRRAEREIADEAYDGEGSASPTADEGYEERVRELDVENVGKGKGKEKEKETDNTLMEDAGAEKNAALLLLNLSMQDGDRSGGWGPGLDPRIEAVEEGPRVKRRRGASA